ncbi:AHH domain-containing protein [Vibrio neptunius]|uniref:AHH domain-containing protein n=1 Tax=Vibrio neptunius TaxID=170651 RepID=UPI0019D05440|nr:AHH domain-containing protein [Vibrio neptunius]MBN3573064.1 AHH domain-containing protein [Vibrio neptunius]
MAIKSNPAPVTSIPKWREYIEWIDKKGKVGEFKGYARRGSADLDASIGGTPAFEELDKEDALEEWKTRHPWALDLAIAEEYDADRVLLTPHHLISCCVTEALTRHFADIIENDIGYNVNSPHNLLILPNSTVVACYLGVPPHEGNHEYALSAVELASTKKILGTKVGQEKIWGKFKKVKKKGYHAKVLKLVHQVIVKHFDCKDNIDHNKFIADMNRVSKKILKKLAKFQWLLHENGADYKLGNPAGCRNTRFISSYIHGPGEEKARARESAKGSLQTGPCGDREHKDDMKYFVHKISKNEMRGRGMRVATEVGWMTSKTAETSETSEAQDNRQTETA